MTHQARDISAIDTRALKEQLAELEQEVRRREIEDRLVKARELEARAQAVGFVSLAEAARTLSGRSQGERTRQVYVNPKNKDQSWSGRGRKPKWVHEHLRKGLPVEDLVPSSTDD